MTKNEIIKNMELVAKVVREHRTALLAGAGEKYERDVEFLKKHTDDFDGLQTSWNDFMTLYNLEIPEKIDVFTLVCAANAACCPEVMDLFRSIDTGVANIDILFEEGII